MRITIKVSNLFLGLLVCIFLPFMTSCDSGGSSKDSFSGFTDTFDRSNSMEDLGSDWVINDSSPTDGTVEILNNEAVFTPGVDDSPAIWIKPKLITTGNYKITLRFKSDTPNFNCDTIQLLARFGDFSNLKGYIATVGYDDAESDTFIRLGLLTTYGPVDIDQIEISSLAANTYYILEFELNEAKLTASLKEDDGTPIGSISVTDSDTKSGTIGIMGGDNNSDACLFVDSITVTGI